MCFKLYFFLPNGEINTFVKSISWVYKISVSNSRFSAFYPLLISWLTTPPNPTNAPQKYRSIPSNCTSVLLPDRTFLQIEFILESVFDSPCFDEELGWYGLHNLCWSKKPYGIWKLAFSARELVHLHPSLCSCVELEIQRTHEVPWYTFELA